MPDPDSPSPITGLFDLPPCGAIPAPPLTGPVTTHPAAAHSFKYPSNMWVASVSNAATGRRWSLPVRGHCNANRCAIVFGSSVELVFLFNDQYLVNRAGGRSRIFVCDLLDFADVQIVLCLVDLWLTRAAYAITDGLPKSSPQIAPWT
jgi:hypothetical protein